MTTAYSPTALLPDNTRRLLGVTVLLTQAPLLFHLPLWICLPGALLVLCRILPAIERRFVFSSLIMAPMVACAAAAIVFHYGEIFNRDPCVAFLFLLVGFKFLESSKNQDASLLVVLSAFLLMTQFFYWQSISAAMLAIPAIFFLALSLFTLQRGTASTDPALMINLTSRLLLQAIPIAMLLFVAVPRVAAPTWVKGHGGNSGITGLSSRMAPGSISSLSKSDEVALRVEFNGKIPAPSNLYWRGPVLSGFDGSSWFILPRATHNTFAKTRIDGVPAATPLSYTVTMEPTFNPWLLALDVPASLPTHTTKSGNVKPIGSITEEKQLNTTIDVNQAIRYDISSFIADSFYPAILPGDEYLLTANTNPQALKFAEELRGKYSNDSALARELLHWFNREKFEYTLSPPKLHGDHKIDEFLFQSRRGFCEHYSGSFVFLLRAAGIPARVVTGYQGGEINDNYMIVRQSDAHAWTEAFIAGKWQRFDPTSAVAPQRLQHGIGEMLRSEGRNSIGRLTLFKSLQLKWDKVNYRWQSLIIGFDKDSQNKIWNKLGFNKPTALGIVLIILAAVIVWVTLILAPWKSLRPRKSDLCEQQWIALCRQFEKRGLSRMTGETATTYINRLSAHWPHNAEIFNDLLAAYHRGRFGAASTDPLAQKTCATIMRRARSQLQS